MLEFIACYIIINSYYIVKDTLKKVIAGQKMLKQKKVSKMTTIHEIKLEITQYNITIM